MREKKGYTGKLLNPFKISGVLEVLKENQWFRVTDTQFRSWGGRRRITEPNKVGKGVEAVMVTYEYEGPVYNYLTNTISIQPSMEAIMGVIPPSIKRENGN
jgi:hypothetical protein